MAKIGVNVKLDAQLKAEFEAFCSQLGMTMTDAFTLFATKPGKVRFEQYARKRRVLTRVHVDVAAE